MFGSKDCLKICSKIQDLLIIMLWIGPKSINTDILKFFTLILLFYLINAINYFCISLIFTYFIYMQVAIFKRYL
jgi:hypothetical protein